VTLQPKQFQLFDPPAGVPSAIHGPEQVDRRPAWERPWDFQDPPHQARMLMPTREVIDTVHKIDSPLMDAGAPPREQWEDIRDEKSSRSVALGIKQREPLPPIRIQQHDEYEPELWDGHHRLRELEDAGHTEVPVWESWDEYEEGYEVRGDRRAGGGFSGNPYWGRTPKS
jgi:hypothetical protein